MKITYIVSNIDLALEFQWVAEQLNRPEFELSFIFLNREPSRLHQLLLKQGIESHELIFSSSRELPQLVLKTRRMLKLIGPDVVHSHLFEASLAGMLAAASLRIRNRIYTRHHSTFHHDYAPKAVWFDRLVNRLAKRIVSISPVVTEVLMKMEKVPERKIVTIEHGVDPGFFSPSGTDAVMRLKNKYALAGHFPVVGMISRFDKWKGLNFAVEAFSQLRGRFPNAKMVIANAIGGDDDANIRSQIAKLPEESCTLITFEPEIGVLYDCFDVFVHVPVDRYAEAFGQIYVEAFFKKVPVVATKSGIGNQLITEETAVEVNYRDSLAILEGIQTVLAMPEEQKQQMAEAAFDSVSRYFIFSRKLEQLETLYRSLVHE